jgi:hypothetical protein
MAPKVSVLLPTFNRLRWLGQSLDSVQAQAVDCEILLLDNGSSDGTWAFIQERAARDPRIRPFHWEENNGMGAYPDLLRICVGEYVTFFADDDEMLPGGLAERVAVLDAHPELGMVFSAVRTMDEDGADQGEASWSCIAEEDRIGGQDWFGALIMANLVPMPSALFRRSLHPGREVLLDNRFGHSKDWQFWLHLARRAPLAYLRRPTVRLRLHRQQATVLYGAGYSAFATECLAIWRYWMTEAEPPHVPTAAGWERQQLTLLNALRAGHGDDPRVFREGLERLQELRAAQDARWGPPDDDLPEAFLHAPAGRGQAWVDLLRAYLAAFGPGEPVVLALVLDPEADGAVTPEQVRSKLTELARERGLDRFPDVALVAGPADLLAFCRNYPHLQWAVPGAEGRLCGRSGRRLAESLRTLATQEPA